MGILSLSSSSSLSLSLVWLVVHLWLLDAGSGGYVGGPCPLGDSWLYDREDNEWTRLEVCSSPVNDGAMIRVGHPILCTTCCVYKWLGTIMRHNT